MATTTTERIEAARGAAGRVWDLLAVRVLLAYLGLRVVSGLLLAQASDQQVWFAGITGPREGDVDLALSWDAQWYQRIAEDGYPDDLPVADGRVQQNPWAFYPVFPLTVRAVSAVTGADFATAAPLLALLAGAGAAVVMALLLRDTLSGAPDGVVLGVVAVWAAAPTTPVLQMAYTESFSMLLLVTFLLLVVRHRWWAAGAVAIVLGLTRPIALPLAAVIVVACWMRWRERAEHPIAARERWGIAAAVVGTGLSGVLWTAVAWAGTGQRDAYPETMTAWRSEASIDVVEPWLNLYDLAREYGDKAFVLPLFGLLVPLVLSLAILVPRVADGVDLRLKVWTAAYAVYLLAVVNGTTSIFRYLVPLFPLAIVLVGAHRRRPSRYWRWRTTFWVVAGVVGQVAWIWWLVLFSPPSDWPP